MGFLDKVKSAAATAKTELERSGLMDQLRPGDTGTSSSPAGSAPTAPAPTLEEELADAVQHGARDPRGLITVDEVSAIAGHPVTLGGSDGPFHAEGLYFDGASVDLIFKGPDDSYTLSVYRSYPDDVAWDAGEWFESSADMDAVTIDGLGDQARSLYGSVYATKGQWGLGAVVTQERVDDARAQQQAVEMLRVALARL